MPPTAFHPRISPEWITSDLSDTCVKNRFSVGERKAEPSYSSSSTCQTNQSLAVNKVASQIITVIRGPPTGFITELTNMCINNWDMR